MVLNEKSVFFLNKSLFYLVLLFIFTTTLPHTTAVQSIVICLFYLIFILYGKDRFKTSEFSFKTPLSFPILLFGVWAFIGLAFAVNKPDSLDYFEAHFLRYVLLYFIIVNIFNSEKKYRGIIWAVLFSTVSFSIIAIIYAWWEGILYAEQSLILGIQKNNLGFMLILSILLCLALLKTETDPRKKFLLIVSLLLLLIMVIIPQSRGTIVGAIAAVLVLFLRNRKMLIIATGTCFILLIIVFHNPYTNRIAHNFIHDPPRISLGHFTLQIIKDYPVFGTGISLKPFHNIREKFPADYNSYISDPRIGSFSQVEEFGGPHFMMGLIAASTGIPGLLLFSYLLYRYFLMTLKLYMHGGNNFIINQSLCLLAAFVMFMIKTLFEPIFLHEVDTFMYILFAMGTVLWSLNKRLAT